MTNLDLIRRLHEHRMWASHNLLDAAARLPRESLDKPLAIGQGSIWTSLTHMYAAEFVWLEALLGNEQASVPGDVPDKLPGNQEGEGGIGSLEELRKKWEQLDARWQSYLASLSGDLLDRPVAKVSTGGKRTSTRAADILLHVCTHAHYTTAQVVNMFRQVVASPLPEVMLIALARQQMAGG